MRKDIFYDDDYNEDEIGEPEYIPCKCKKCGFTEDVPDFVLDEFAGFERFIGKKNVIPKLECPECGKVMIPLKYFKD